MDEPQPVYIRSDFKNIYAELTSAQVDRLEAFVNELTREDATSHHFTDCPKYDNIYAVDWCDCSQRIARGEPMKSRTP